MSDYPVTANALYQIYNGAGELVSEAGVESTEGSTLSSVPSGNYQK